MTASRYWFRCTTVDETRAVVLRLLDGKIPPRNIRVLSSEPIHDLAERLSRKSWLPWLVIAGAAGGAVAGYGLAAGTAMLYPLNTGGMPVVSQLPVGIIAYEAMMLLAILFTLAGVLVEGRLLQRRSKSSAEHARAVAEGETRVLVLGTSENEDLWIKEVGTTAGGSTLQLEEEVDRS